MGTRLTSAAAYYAHPPPGLLTTLPFPQVHAILAKEPSARTPVEVSELMSEMQRLTLFAFKPESVRRRLCQRLWFSELREPGAVVAEPGEAARQWWVILSGSVVAGEPPPDAQHSVDLSGMTHLTEGDSFGADSAVPTPRQVSRTVLSTGTGHGTPCRQP